MKKKLFIMALFGVLLFSGCSSEDENNNGINGDVTTNYLSVNIVATPNAGTRAVQDADNYEKGLTKENTVKSVRFYFFDSEGNAAPVKKNDNGTYDSHYDWTTPAGNGQDMPNVEKILDVTLIIDGTKDKRPTSIVAIINPPTGLSTNLSLAQLNELVSDYSDTNSFIMSNSVYSNGATNNAIKMEAVSVDGHLYPTSSAALADPVSIYVERVLAKVRLENTITANVVTLTDGTKLIPTSRSTEISESNDVAIYAKFLGWNVTATTDKSRLMKEINPAWDVNLFNASEPWNYVPYFRSFWAVNPADLNYGYGTFNNSTSSYPEESATIDPANSIKYFDGGTEQNPQVNYTYIQENAASDIISGTNPTTPTQVIIAAQLVDAQGEALEFAEWAFHKYTVDDLKNLMTNNATLYKGSSKKKIEPSDIEFQTATAIGEADKDRKGRYYVFAQLTEEAKNETWYSSNAENTQSIDTKTANDKLKELGHAKIWKNGYTYYYFDIKHLNTQDTGVGQVGVVRNHLYDARITSLVGLGTPVYDSDETIYPEKPEDDTYIAAKINILSWRIVPNDITLQWP